MCAVLSPQSAGEFIVTTNPADTGVALVAHATKSMKCLPKVSITSLRCCDSLASGAVVFADAGTGRVLSIQSSGVEVLGERFARTAEKGVAIAADGTCLVAEEAAGRIVKIGRGGVDTVLDGLQQPQGILVRGDSLYVVDAGSKELIEYNLSSKARRTIAGGLPLGAPAGVEPKFLRPFPPLSGSIGPFAGIAAGADGALYVSADGDGSVLALRPR